MNYPTFLKSQWRHKILGILVVSLLGFAAPESRASGPEMIYSVQGGDIRSVSVDTGSGAEQSQVYFGEFKNNTGAVLKVLEGAAPLTAPSRLFENLSVLDSTIQIPGNFQFDPFGQIYFGYGGYATHIIRRGPKDGSTASATLFSVSGGHFFGLIGDDIYYMSNFNTLWKRPNYGASSPEALLNGYWIRAWAINHGIFFFQNYGDKQYRRFDTVTRTLTPIFPNVIEEAPIFADDRYLYRVTGGNIDRTLNSGGGPVERVISGTSNVTAMLFHSDTVYFSTSTGIYSFPRDSSLPVTVETVLAVNSPLLKTTSSNYLYWAQNGGSASSLYRLRIPVVHDPIADAGPDQSVNEGDSVALNGAASSGPLGAAITYSWSQVGGPAVTLTGSTSANPAFSSPYVASSQVLTFQLTVTDASGNSASDHVDVSVIQYNDPPQAEAGLDGTVKEGAARMLDGSASWDNNAEDIVDYQWGQISGPAVTLAGAGTATPTFVAPAGAAGQSVIFALIVSDGKEPSETDTVSITIVENSAPAAQAGNDQTKDEGAIVILDGTASSDQDIGDGLTFAWHQTGGPAVALLNSSSPVATFNAPPVSGAVTLTFELTVTDDDAVTPKSGTDVVVINIRDVNAPPSCNLAVASKPKLWPPDHKMEAVTINGVTDSDAGYNTVSITVTGVTQDEATQGTGDGDTSPDASIVAGNPAESLLIRRERAGNGNGRVYAIAFTASDGFESCNGAVTLSVRRNNNGSNATDDGQAFNSILP